MKVQISWGLFVGARTLSAVVSLHLNVSPLCEQQALLNEVLSSQVSVIFFQ